MADSFYHWRAVAISRNEATIRYKPQCHLVVMGFKPDYGLRRHQDGVSPTVDLFFYNFRMFSLTILGSDEYSTASDTQYAGQLRCLSLDFNQAQLDQMLAKAEQHLATHLRAELARDLDSPRSIEFKAH